MTRAPVALLTVLTLAAATPALAAAYGGATILSFPAQSQAPAGYSLARPDLLASAGSLRVHGVICRPAGGLGLPVREVRVERLGPAGQVLGEVAGPVAFDSVRRSASCTTYDLAAPWTLDPTDSLRAIAL